jgi:hypothetical protein
MSGGSKEDGSCVVLSSHSASGQARERRGGVRVCFFVVSDFWILFLETPLFCVEYFTSPLRFPSSWATLARLKKFEAFMNFVWKASSYRVGSV